MKYLNIFNNLKKAEVGNYENLIQKLNENFLHTQKQLTIYINKFLQNEEKWKLINYLIQKINSTLEIESLIKLINSQIIKLVEADFCNVFLYEKTNQQLVNKNIETTISNTQTEYMKYFLEDKNALLPKFINSIPDYTNPDLRDFLNENLNENYLIVPIVNSSKFFGIIFLYKNSAPISTEEINILEVIAKNISMTFKNSELYEKLKQSNSNKVQFIASLTHEFKTPLSSIIGFSEIIKSEPNISKSQINSYLDNVLNCSSHLLKLIEDIQDASIAECGNFSIYNEKFNTKSIINNIMSEITTLALEKNIKIKAHLIDTNIYADSKRFKQIIYNLFSNAIKFSYNNETIKIFTYLEDNKFYFEICNKGEIIKQQDKNKIFKLFYQASDISHKYKGAGIGLSICKKIISQHGGEIDFRSDNESGTTFFFWLPMKIDSQASGTTDIEINQIN